MFATRSDNHRSPKACLLSAVVLAGAMIFAGAAHAAPLGFGKSATMAYEPEVSLVRDGCGRGMRFSNRRGGCVPDGSRHIHHDDRRGHHQNNDAAVAVATGAAVLGIIAAGSHKNKNHNHGTVKVHNSNHKKKH